MKKESRAGELLTGKETFRRWLLRLLFGVDGMRVVDAERAAADIAAARAAYANFTAAEQEAKAAQARLNLAGNELAACLGGFELVAPVPPPPTPLEDDHSRIGFWPQS